MIHWLAGYPDVSRLARGVDPCPADALVVVFAPKPAGYSHFVPENGAYVLEELHEIRVHIGPATATKTSPFTSKLVLSKIGIVRPIKVRHDKIHGKVYTRAA